MARWEVWAPVTRPFDCASAVTSTPSRILTPSSRARRANAFVTSAGPAMASWGPQTAAIRSSTRRAGTSFCESAGLMTRPSAPSVRLRELLHLLALEELDGGLARSARERVRHLGWPCHGVLGPPDRRDQVVHAEGGDELLRVGGPDDADVRAQRSLERDPLLEPAEV